MIKDYSEGRLDKSRIFYRAIIIDVDTEGGKLESRPPNPPNSIRARIYTNGMDANTPDSALTIFYPLFPSHISAPVEINEHVYVMFEDESMSNGVWVTTVPAHRDINYGDPELKRLSSKIIKSSNVFEGTSPAPLLKSNYDEEFGGLATENANRKKIVGVFSSESNSFFKDKKVLLLGDSLAAGPVAEEFSTILKQKKVKTYKKEGRKNFGTKQWAASKARGTNSKPISELVDETNPDIVIILIGTDDVLAEGDYNKDDIKSVLGQLSEATNIFWVSPPKMTGPSTGRNQRVKQIVDAQSEVLQEDYIDITSISGTTGRDSKGIGFSGQGVKSIVESIVAIIEQRFV
jgi:hypothetical protein